MLRLFHRRTSDAVLAVFVLAITALLLVPLPTVILDFLLVINLSFSLLLLLAGLYLPNALSLLSFPSILLLTTLFRLGLNVASTRLILTQGDAGEVILAFGTFLVRGEIVVGLVIFAILTVVNFIVVARGSARVSEVAARFALDALPGKQMAIDADLRSGLISASEAQRRRDDLRKESQLYGAMDGAMKFVQGDAVAGLFIIATNILGGMYMGVSSGLSFGEAISTYTILTIGDGLVHQIPAILISICAGIVVTRVASEEGSSLSSDVHSQLFTRWGSTLFTGIIISLLGITPGLPTAPFLGVGLFMMGAAFYQRHRAAYPDFTQERAAGGGSDLPIARTLLPIFAGEGENGDSRDSLGVRVHLDHTHLFRGFRENQERFGKWWESFEKAFYDDTGISLPRIKVVSDRGLPMGSYSLWIGGDEVEERNLNSEALLVEVNPMQADVFGFEVLEEDVHPLHGERVFWTARQEGVQKIVDSASVSALEPFQFISYRIAAFFLKYPEEVLSVGAVLDLELELEEENPGLLSRTINREFFSSARCAELLQQLIREGVSVRDFKQIIESVARYCGTSGAGLVREGEFDLEDLVAYVRATRRRHIVARALSPRKTLKVLTLSASLEELLETSAVSSSFGVVTLEPEGLERWRSSLRECAGPIFTRGILPISLLVRADLRSKVVSLLRQTPYRIGVITFEELEPLINVEPVAQIS